ncbi:serine/arginine repetitive matrix protein 2 [Drosophila subpulchrella]|uniref:serine/arginine repetitive matrix protein 2 n=1 Tax=Drosophila subpulchrella TaxID=1486046 RepID=UPI0018A160BE|nr:serine/arginine repetitive matrix protein 2 [Drosophila subpulchrella]
MTKVQANKAKDEGEPAVKRERREAHSHKRDRRERKSRKNRKESAAGGSSWMRNRSPTPSNASVSSEEGSSDSSYSDSSYSSTGSSSYTSYSSSTSSSSSSSDSEEKPEGAGKKSERSKHSCCRRRHHRRHRRHHPRHSHRHRRGNRRHHSDHGRSSKRLARKSRRGVSSAKVAGVVKEEGAAAVPGVIQIPAPIPLPVPAPIPAVLPGPEHHQQQNSHSHLHPRSHPQPVPAPVPAPTSVTMLAPVGAVATLEHRKPRMRCSGSQTITSATSGHSQAITQSSTITITKTIANTTATAASHSSGNANTSSAKTKVGGSRISSSACQPAKVAIAAPAPNKPAHQAKPPVAAASSKGLMRANPNASSTHSSSNASNAKAPTAKEQAKNPKPRRSHSRGKSSNNDRCRRGPATPTSAEPSRQGKNGRNDNFQWNQRRNNHFGGEVASGVAGGRRSHGGTDGEGNQTAFRNGKDGFKFRQPVRIVRLHIKGLTRQVTKEHITEIFGHFGALTAVDFPMDRYLGRQGRGYAFVEYARPEDCASAIKHMNGGQIDGKRITVSAFQESMLKAPWRHYRRYSPVNRRHRTASRSMSRSRSRSKSGSQSARGSRSTSRSRSRFRSKSRSRYNRRYRSRSRSSSRGRGRSRSRSSPRYGKYNRPGSRSP